MTRKASHRGPNRRSRSSAGRHPRTRRLAAERLEVELYADLVDDLPDDYQGSYRLQVDLALTGQTTDGQDVEGSDTLDLFLSGKNLRDLVEELGLHGAI